MYDILAAVGTEWNQTAAGVTSVEKNSTFSVTTNNVGTEEIKQPQKSDEIATESCNEIRNVKLRL